MKAIILAGGLGTRLRSVVYDIPKSMADINGRPFLEFQIDTLIAQGIKEIVLSVGYKSEVIINHFGEHYKDTPIRYVMEDEPLGTGGAIMKSLDEVDDGCIYVLNGDSIFMVDLVEMMAQHTAMGSDATLALKPMTHFSRYGRVVINEENRVINFLEKQPCDEGLISGGIYLVDVPSLKSLTFPEKFSIERDYFEKHLTHHNIAGHLSDGYFLDIGIPEDYQRAQEDFHSLFHRK